MSNLALLDSQTLAGYTLHFQTGGNPRITGNFQPTGHMPNLPDHLRKNDIHPLDYFGAVTLLQRETRDGQTVSLYRIIRPTGRIDSMRPITDDDPYVYLLAENVDHPARTITYTEYQLDRDEFERRAYRLEE